MNKASAPMTGLQAIADRYDGFILDLWGVIHDGQSCYPGALECLQHLRTAGKRIVLLSNAPRREAFTRQHLDWLGVPANAYDAVVTSGETTRLCLMDAAWRKAKGFGTRYYRLGPAEEEDILKESGLVATTQLAQADFLLLIGPVDYEKPMHWYDPLLAEAASLNLPALCANPDIVVVRQDGTAFPCAGTIAERYAGPVTFIGKPYPEVYERALELLDVAGENVLAVGDNPATDIAGAHRMRLDSALVTGGILGGKAENTPGTPAQYLLPAFRW